MAIARTLARAMATSVDKLLVVTHGGVLCEAGSGERGAGSGNRD
jgi:hypothetical protein